MKTKRLFIACVFLLPGVLFAQVITVKIDSGKNSQNKRDSAFYNDIRELKKIPRDTSTHSIAYFERNFQQKYTSDSDFDYSHSESKGKSFFQRLLMKIRNFLNKYLGINTLKKADNVTYWAVRILGALFILTILFFAVRLIMRKNGQWFFQRKNESVSIDIYDVEELIKSADFETMIHNYEQKGETRQSIRLYYLWLLKMLNNRRLINWNPQKTNADYVSEIDDERVKEKFSYLSYLFNYIWYGEFQITDSEYVSAKNAFLDYLKNNGNHE